MMYSDPGSQKITVAAIDYLAHFISQRKENINGKE